MVSLQNHPMFNDIELVETRLQKVDDQEVREFKIKLALNPTMTMADLEPTRRDRGLNVNPLGGPITIQPTANR